MNRFETYQPINFEIPEYVQNPEAFAKILAGQDALFEQKQKEKESMLSAGDKLAQSLKYAPEESYKKIYDQTLSDYRAAQDEVETAYKTKGIPAGEAALRKYKKTLSDDFTNGRASKLMSSAAQWEDTKKRVTEMYKDNPQAAYHYLNGAGKSEWFKPYEEGKDANIGQPSLLKSLKDADVTKAIVETLKNVKPNIETVLSYLSPETPIHVKNQIMQSPDPYHYIMDETVRKYVDEDKLRAGLIGNLSPDVLEHMELEGRIKGIKGMGNLKNLMVTYAIDRDGNITELSTPDEVRAAKQDNNLKVKTTFNPRHLYGEQFNNLIASFDAPEITHDYKVIETGLKHEQDLAMRERTLNQQAKNAADDNYWKAKNYALGVAKLEEDKKQNATLSFGTQGNAVRYIPPFADVDEKGEPVVNKGTISKFKTNSEKRLQEINNQLGTSNDPTGFLANVNNMIGNTAKPLAPEQIKALKSEKEHLESEIGNLRHFEEEFNNHPEQFGYVGNDVAEKELKKAGYYDNLVFGIGDKTVKMTPKELMESNYIVEGENIYQTQLTHTKEGGGVRKVKVGHISEKQANIFKKAVQASKNNEANIENRDRAYSEALAKTITGNTPMFYTNPTKSDDYNKAFQNAANFNISNLNPKSVMMYNGKEYTTAALADLKAREAGHTDWKFVGFKKGDKNIPAKVGYYKKGNNTEYGVETTVTGMYESEDGKSKEMTYNVTVPSSNSSGQPNFVEPTLEAKRNAPETKAGLKVERAKNSPGVVFNKNGVRLYSGADGKFYLDSPQGKRQEIPESDALEISIQHEKNELDNQLNPE